MAKKQWGWLTSIVAAGVVGAADQQLIHEADAGNLGGLTPAQTQTGLAGLVTVGSAVGKLLTKRPGTMSRIYDGSLYSAVGLLAQSGMHQVDRMMDRQATKTTTTATGSGSGSDSSTNSDASADASVASASADATQDNSDSVSSSTDGGDTGYGAN